MSKTRFGEGGYIPPAAMRMQVVDLDPDECVMRPVSEGALHAVCLRADHPTAKSGCSQIPWIKHIAEEAS